MSPESLPLPWILSSNEAVCRELFPLCFMGQGLLLTCPLWGLTTASVVKKYVTGNSQFVLFLESQKGIARQGVEPS